MTEKKKKRRKKRKKRKKKRRRRRKKRRRRKRRRSKSQKLVIYQLGKERRAINSKEMPASKAKNTNKLRKELKIIKIGPG